MADVLQTLIWNTLSSMHESYFILIELSLNMFSKIHVDNNSKIVQLLALNRWKTVPEPEITVKHVLYVIYDIITLQWVQENIPCHTIIVEIWRSILK